jgi:hypothetical protein
MVQIVRRRRSQCDESDLDHLGRSHSFRRRNRLQAGQADSSFKTCIQFLLLSSIVPVLFFLRFARDDLSSFLRYKLTIPATLPAPFDFLPDLLVTYAKQSSRQYTSSEQLDVEWLHSDIVELHHCKSIWTSPIFGWTNFTTWAEPLVNQTRLQLHLPLQQQKEQGQQEIILELLELYSLHYGYCDFSRYRPTLGHESNAFGKTAMLATPPGLARCAIVIAVHRLDPTHFKRLLQAIHMPHHYVVLYLDRHAPESWHSSLVTIAKSLKFDNIEVIQFGTIQAEDRSIIHLKIMRWLTIELGLTFDYHITLDSSSFPLLSAKAMAQHLHASSQSVWLGTLTEQGNLPSKSQTHRLVNTRLVTTSTPATVTLGRIFSDNTVLPDLLVQDNRLLMNHKTASGSYAIFSQSLVQRLLSSPKALQIFALSKYGTSLESYNWMAALQLLRTTDDNNSILPGNNNIVNQAKLFTSMFQLWGGTNDREKALRDDADAAVLSVDPTKCYRIEHASVVKAVRGEPTNTTVFSPSDWAIPQERLVLHGIGDVWTHIKGAIQVGFLFARQFDSSDKQSVELLEAIENSWKAD